MQAMQPRSTSRGRVRKPLAVLLALLLALAVAACGGNVDRAPASGDNDADSDPEQLTTITFLSPAPYGITVPPFVVADELGLFEDEGIEFEYSYLGEDVNVISLMLNDNGEIAYPGALEAMQAHGSGQDITVIYEAAPLAGEGIVVPEDSDATSIQDLAGRTVGTGDQDTDALFRQMLVASGMSEDDVEIVRVGTSGPTVARMLAEGEIDAYTAGIPDFAALRANDIELTDITPPKFGRVPAGTFAVTDEIAEELGPDLLGGFLRAYAKATYLARSDPDAAEAILRAQVPEDWEDPETTRGLMEELLRIAEPGEHWGGLDPAVWENVVQKAVEGDVLDEPIPVSEIISDQYLDTANDWEREEAQAILEEWKADNM